ncbi:MAG: SGNH/GDSL hydrolase family protein [Myxococcota bacterium]
MRRLYAAGGRRFLVMNLPNLGKTPIVLQNQSYVPFRRPKSEAERRLVLSRKLGELSAYHNQKLASAVAQLDRELPEAQLVSVDTARLVDEILEGRAPDATRERFDYGFALRDLESEVRDGRTHARFQKRCYAGGYLGSLDASSVCPQSEQAMFWDVVHPTSYTLLGRVLRAARAGAGRPGGRAGLAGRAPRLLHRTHPAGLVHT